MSYTIGALRDKIIELHPEIEMYGLLVWLTFHEGSEVYFVNFRRGTHLMSTYLGNKEADECMANIKCSFLDGHIRGWITCFTKVRLPDSDMPPGQIARNQGACSQAEFRHGGICSPTVN